MVVTEKQRALLVDAFAGMIAVPGPELERLEAAYEELKVGQPGGDIEIAPSLATILVILGFEKQWPRSVPVHREMKPLFAAAGAMIVTAPEGFLEAMAAAANQAVEGR